MNLICPLCQKTLTIADQYAGQLMKCPLCQGTFMAPGLPSAAPKLASGPPSAPAPSPITLPGPSVPPPGTAPQPPPRETPSVGGPLPSPETLAADKPAPPPPTEGYRHHWGFAINPVVVTWVTPALMVIAFLLFLFPWTGAYPGGHSVYTQAGWQVVPGWFTTNPVGDEEFALKKTIEENSWFGLPTLAYFLFLLLGTGLAVASAIVPRIAVPLPPVVQSLLQWRPLLVGGVTLLALLILFLQLGVGLPLENAIAAVVDRGLEKRRAEAVTPEKQQKLEMIRGAEIGKFNLSRTFWLSLAIGCQLAATANTFLDFWLIRRASRPTPRMDFTW